jgi:hypothetical protein
MTTHRELLRMTRVDTLLLDAAQRRHTTVATLTQAFASTAPFPAATDGGRRPTIHFSRSAGSGSGKGTGGLW